jgi:hypothetical protein
MAQNPFKVTLDLGRLGICAATFRGHWATVVFYGLCDVITLELSGRLERLEKVLIL